MPKQGENSAEGKYRFSKLTAPYFGLAPVGRQIGSFVRGGLREEVGEGVEFGYTVPPVVNHVLPDIKNARVDQ